MYLSYERNKLYMLLCSFTCKITYIIFEFEENKTLLAWDFNSLLQAIELIFAFNQTNDRKEVKMCKHCNKPFIAKNLNAEYDTASCRNMANVYRNRAKNKNK